MSIDSFTCTNLAHFIKIIFYCRLEVPSLTRVGIINPVAHSRHREYYIILHNIPTQGYWAYHY